MRELTMEEQQMYDGGSFLGMSIIAGIFGTAIYKLLVSNRGRISLPSIISFEWSK